MTEIMTEDGRRTLTIEQAVVSIQAVRIDGKPMTIAVFNQLPRVAFDKDGDTVIGRIRRCPDKCLPGEGTGNAHVHILVVRGGRPVLARFDTGPDGRGTWEDYKEHFREAAHQQRQAESFLDVRRAEAAGAEAAKQREWAEEAKEEARAELKRHRTAMAWIDALPQVYIAA